MGSATDGVPYRTSNRLRLISKRKGISMFLFKDRRRLAISGAIVLLCGLGLAYWLFFRPDPALVHAQELSHKLRENLPVDQRRELMRDLRQAMEELTPEQRRTLAKD